MIKRVYKGLKRHFSVSEKLLRKARKFPRYTPVHINSAGLQLHVADLLSVAYQLKEYFFDEEFLLPFSMDSKLKIYDLGANMGIATLYFKRKYPNAEIVVYEADPDICNYLRENIKGNLDERQLRDIKINCQAVWIEDGEVEFKSEGADSGAVSARSTTGKKIPAIDFRNVMENEQTIDFLKMDIEGAEYEVIKAIGRFLKKVKMLFIEFHFSPDNDQQLDILIKILNENGFDYYLKNTNPVTKPFTQLLGMNTSYQVCIYAVNKNF